MPDGPSAQGAAQMKESEAAHVSICAIMKSWSRDLACQEKMNLESFLNYVAFNKKADSVMGWLEMIGTFCFALVVLQACIDQSFLSGDPFQAPVQKLDLSEADADKANAEAPCFALFCIFLNWVLNSCARLHYAILCLHFALLFDFFPLFCHLASCSTSVEAQMVLRGALNFKRVDVAKAKRETSCTKRFCSITDPSFNRNSTINWQLPTWKSFQPRSRWWSRWIRDINCWGLLNSFTFFYYLLLLCTMCSSWIYLAMWD